MSFATSNWLSRTTTRHWISFSFYRFGYSLSKISIDLTIAVEEISEIDKYELNCLNNNKACAYKEILRPLGIAFIWTTGSEP